jgi:transcription initiation factor TFIID subunit 2
VQDSHPTHPWKKVSKFIQGQAVAPQHVSIAVGPFERVNLSEYRDVENEEAMGTMSVDVLGYCLPGREAELKNTCMFLPKVHGPPCLPVCIANDRRPLIS